MKGILYCLWKRGIESKRAAHAHHTVLFKEIAKDSTDGSEVAMDVTYGSQNVMDSTHENSEELEQKVVRYFVKDLIDAEPKDQGYCVQTDVTFSKAIVFGTIVRVKRSDTELRFDVNDGTATITCIDQNYAQFSKTNTALRGSKEHETPSPVDKQMSSVIASLTSANQNKIRLLDRNKFIAGTKVAILGNLATDGDGIKCFKMTNGKILSDNEYLNHLKWTNDFYETITTEDEIEEEGEEFSE